MVSSRGPAPGWLYPSKKEVSGSSCRDLLNGAIGRQTTGWVMEAGEPGGAGGDLDQRRRTLRRELDEVHRQIARAEKRLLRLERRQEILAERRRRLGQRPAPDPSPGGPAAPGSQGPEDPALGGQGD
jgi:hypothetical protein